MATISKALNYKIVADTGDFQRDLKAAQKELKAAERAMLDTMTPAQKMETRIASLDKQLADGKIKTEEYTKANERLRASFARTQEIEAATKALERMNKTRGERVADKLGALPLVGHLGGDVGKAVDLFTGGMGPMAAIGTIAGVATVAFREFREESEKIDKLNKSALSMGFSTEAALVLQKQAKKVDVEFDAVAQSVRKMNKAIGEAKSGDAGKQDAFASLGLDARKLGSMKPEEAFLQVSDALRQMTDPYQRAAIGADIFGKESATLNEVLRMGSQEFNALAAAMDAAGQRFSGKQADDVERANKSYEKLGSTWRTLKMNMTIAAAPGIERSLDGANKALEKNATLMERAKGYAQFWWGWSGLMGQNKTQAESPEDRPQEDPEVKQAREEAKKASDEQRRTREQAKKSLQEMASSLQLQTGQQHMSAEAAKAWNDAVKAGDEALGRHVIKLLELKEAQKKAADATKKATEETQRMREETMFANLPIREAAIALEKYRAIRDGASRQAAEELAGLKMQRLAREELNKALNEGQTPLDKYKSTLAELTLLQVKFPAFMRQLEAAKTKAGEELSRGLGFDAKSLRTPFEELKYEIENLAKLKAAGVLKDEQLARAKQAAMKKYWDAEKQPAGIEAMKADSQEFRLMQEERKQEQLRRRDADAAVAKIEGQQRQQRQLEDFMAPLDTAAVERQRKQWEEFNAPNIERQRKQWEEFSKPLPQSNLEAFNRLADADRERQRLSPDQRLSDGTLGGTTQAAFAPPPGWYEAMLTYTQQQATRQSTDPAVEITAGRI